MPIKILAAVTPPEADRIFIVRRKTRCIDQKLLRHASPYYAGTSHAKFFSDSDSCSVGGGNAGSAYATGAAANDKQIKIKLGHDPKVKRAARSDKSKLLIGYIHPTDAGGDLVAGGRTQRSPN